MTCPTSSPGITYTAQMVKSKLLPPLPTIPGANRRQLYSASTKRALVDVAEDLFTSNGYASASLDAIVSGARVTKGALYHHFSGKQALFEAVFDRVEQKASATIRQALKGHVDPWDKAQAGLRAFIDVVREPEYRRIVIQEGPSVLGYERFREQEERSTFATVRDIVRSVTSAGPWPLDDDMLLAFSRIFFGALSSAGASVSVAEDPHAAGARMEAALVFILAGLRSVVEAGQVIPGTDHTWAQVIRGAEAGDHSAYQPEQVG